MDDTCNHKIVARLKRNRPVKQNTVGKPIIFEVSTKKRRSPKLHSANGKQLSTKLLNEIDFKQKMPTFPSSNERFNDN